MASVTGVSSNFSKDETAYLQLLDRYEELSAVLGQIPLDHLQFIPRIDFVVEVLPLVCHLRTLADRTTFNMLCMSYGITRLTLDGDTCSVVTLIERSVRYAGPSEIDADDVDDSTLLRKGALQLFAMKGGALDLLLESSYSVRQMP